MKTVQLRLFSMSLNSETEILESRLVLALSWSGPNQDAVTEEDFWLGQLSEIEINLSDIFWKKKSLPVHPSYSVTLF